MGARSKGCISCKARRVKCDESRPTCRRCHNAGIACKGYSSPFEFINETMRVERAVAVATSQQDDLSALQSSSRVLYHTSQVPPQSRNTPLSTEIPITAFKHTVFLSYLLNKLSEDQPGPAKCWIEGTSSASRNALIALAAMVFGQAHDSRDTIVEARKAYGKALIDLRDTLSDAPRHKSFDTMASVTALCMYESGIDSRSSSSWYHHADGLASLMQVNGPAQYNHDHTNGFFPAQRVMLVSKAIMTGTPTFLSSHDWKNIPWQNIPASKEPSDYLVDVFCDVASRQVEMKRYINAKPYVQGLDMKSKIVTSIRKLDAWWKDWWRNNPRCCREKRPSSRNSFASYMSDSAFAPDLEFTGLKTAFTVATYDAIRILLLSLLKTILYCDQSCGRSMLPDDEAHQILNRRADSRYGPLHGISADTSGLAREICQTFEYCSRTSDRQFLFSVSCMLDLDIAYSSLHPDSREARWIRSQMMQSEDWQCGNCATEVLPIKLLPSCQLMKAAMHG